jgi:hypothetical protein
MVATTVLVAVLITETPLAPDRLKDCLNRSSENNRHAKDNWEKYIEKHPSFKYGEDRADEWEFAYLPADKEEREELPIPKLPLVLDFPHITRRVAHDRYDDDF